jgi:hypothetical protein
MAILTDTEELQKQRNLKLSKPLVKEDLPVKVTFREKGRENQLFYSLIPYSFWKTSYENKIKLPDLKPQKRQLKFGDTFEIVDVSPYSSQLYITKDGFGIPKNNLVTWFDLIEEKPVDTKLEKDSGSDKNKQKSLLGLVVLGLVIYGIYKIIKR